METFQEVAESQVKKEESEGTTATAVLLDKLSVEEKKDEKKAEEEAAPVPTTKEDAKEPEKAESKKDEWETGPWPWEMSTI